jgi:hypothetical protein
MQKHAKQKHLDYLQGVIMLKFTQGTAETAQADFSGMSETTHM